MEKWNNRSTDEEIMDDLDCKGEVVSQTLKEIENINNWLGGNEVTIQGIRELTVRNQKIRALKIADLGCGGGEMLKKLDHSLSDKVDHLELLGIDANPFIVQQAKENCRDHQNIEIALGNVLDPELQIFNSDIITCTLFTHHFDFEELVNLLKTWREKARIGIVINDLHRHPLAYYSIKILTQLFSRSEMVKYDAPLSVLRGFTRTEWEEL